MSHPFGIPIPILGVTGDIYTGKTIFLLSIAPGHFEGDPARPRTLYIDFEQSGASYEGTGSKRVDAPAELRKQFGAGTYKPVDVFNWFRAYIGAIPPNTYDVIVCDPITDVEDGLVDYVQGHPAEFGYTKDQFASGSGLMWGAVKNFWKLILVDLSSRCFLFGYSTHMRMEFKNGRPTNRLIPKGKETLAEISSLYIRLERDATREGEKSQPPSGIIIKERLSLTQINPKTGEVEVVRMLPDRLPIATVKALKHYIAHPVGKRTLKPEEMIQEPTMSDDDRLILQAEIAKAQAEAEANKLSLWNATKTAPLTLPGIPTPPVPGPTPPATMVPPTATPPQALPMPPTAITQVGYTQAASPVNAELANPELQTAILGIKELGRAFYGTPQAFGEAFVRYFTDKGGLKSLEQMTLVQAYEYKAFIKREQALANVHAKHGYEPRPDPTLAMAEQAQQPPAQDMAPIEPFKGPEPMEPDQQNTLKALCDTRNPGSMSTAEQEAWKEYFQVDGLRHLNQEQFQFLMNRRSERLNAQASQPAPETASTSP